jgi:NAD(P)-dependent dehydrogenase (short-subunit alcohol dehydrogenase family)
MASITLEPHPKGFFSFFYENQIKTKPRPPPAGTSFSGQTAIVTGSNIGLGLECSRILLDYNLSHIILAVRSLEKGEKSAETLLKTRPKAQVEVWPLDMLSYDSIQTFVRRCAGLQRLDMVILNAGMGGLHFEINEKTGHEKIFQTNYLSTALLAILLLPVLKDKSPLGKPGRLSIVSSGLALQSAFKNRSAVPLIPSFDDKTGWGVAAASERYNVTKTMILMLVLKLSEQVSTDDVVINAVDPSYVKGTGLDREVPGLVKLLILGPLKTMARTAEQGAWTYVDAVGVKGKESHGCFVMNWKIAP